MEQISEEGVAKALQNMESGKAVSPDSIPIKACEIVGNTGIDSLTEVFINIMEKEEMPDEWRSICPYI